MILRCQCRRLTSLIPCKQYNKNSLPSLSVYRSSFHTSSIRRADEFDDDADPGIDDAESYAADDLPPSSPKLGDLVHQSKRNPSIDDGTRRMTLAQIDRSMNIEELGLKSVRRSGKREFVRWLMQEGARYEHYPQRLIMDIENRRVEKARKRAEDRMFARMNKFYNSLTLEEIQEGKLNKPEGRTNNMKPEELDTLRPPQPEPTPFQRLMTGAEDIRMTPKQIESGVLMLLKQHDGKLHTMYKHYIDWTDYELQKRTMWFSFPRTSKYGDIIKRITGPNPKKAEPQSPESLDLATYYGPRLPDDTAFPLIPIAKTHYLGASDIPFRLNPTFKPWRPIPHSLRLKMFDAWRERLGLRNVAWLGGVSWRRVDGVIGILKKEWEFVQKGGKLEEEMAEYMETLLAQTPLHNSTHPPPELPVSQSFLFKFKLEDPVKERRKNRDEESLSSPEDLTESDVPLADPKMIPISGVPFEPTAPNPDDPIYLRPQARYGLYVAGLNKIDENNHNWLASQKEPLVEVPINRTKQYFALVGEMEEYSEKRAAQALDGVGGKTMTEKEEGIKKFERLHGGLRSLKGREKFQGIPPWERNYTPEERKKLAKEAKKAMLAGPRRAVEAPIAALTPVDAFRQKVAGSTVPSTSNKQAERVVWRFEDVSWVKQRTIRPRKVSYAGTLDRRVQLESGVERYGPFGIGSGIEGVGGVKRIIERGTDGHVRLQKPTGFKNKKKREIVV